jgi:hypothetical protein
LCVGVGGGIHIRRRTRGSEKEFREKSELEVRVAVFFWNDRCGSIIFGDAEYEMCGDAEYEMCEGEASGSRRDDISHSECQHCQEQKNKNRAACLREKAVLDLLSDGKLERLRELALQNLPVLRECRERGWERPSWSWVEEK